MPGPISDSYEGPEDEPEPIPASFFGETPMNAGQQFLADFVHLLRVKKVFARYCREGKRPSKEEAKAWLESLGWQPHPLANLLREWGYED